MRTHSRNRSAPPCQRNLPFALRGTGTARADGSPGLEGGDCAGNRLRPSTYDCPTSSSRSSTPSACSLPIPRQRGLEPDEIPSLRRCLGVVAGHVNRGDPARKLVQVHAANTELIGRVQPMRFRDSLVVVMRPSESNLLHERRRPDAVVRPADALRRIRAGSGERLQSAENAERRGSRVLAF